MIRKNKLIYLLLSSAFFLLANFSHAQIAGYMGKRWIVNYDFKFINALSGPNKNLESDFMAFTASNSFGVEYILNRNSTIGFRSTFYKTGVHPEYSVEIDFKDPSSGEMTSTSYVPDFKEVISVIHNGIFYKSFMKFLAPIGGYSEIGAELISYKPDFTSNDIPPYTFRYYQNGEKNSSYQPDFTIKNRYNSLAITYAVGKQTVYFDKLILRFGVSFAYVLGTMKTYLYTENYTTENYVGEMVKQRVVSNNAIKFNFGLGYLIH
jgi:hypothetical protein